ncbi:uncharacterized protein DUF4395 [Jatrophihabitans sp. GAS493]|uniref:DUF4395 domain-containing protein n=1 Tax=Jatrophihabitans sp. GAS493 TaxID=1907575 RepID=UPI000BB90703|nr:DUF4395 domain-containing protein [Jatrophihabitans sp. GAS493]SOD71439.1 uncharacterized protein DUF4395 [Jatrophihabitans sp. GAS493]
MSKLLSFPNPVNEKAARVVAGGVVLIALLALLTGWLWLSAVLFAGFALRVASGPRFSPLGQLATRVIAPRLGEAKLVAGPPKRFAQTIGLVVTGGATLAWFGAGSALATEILLGLIVVAATLESVFAICLGCLAFGWLMRVGVIPEETCEACNNVAARYGTA